MKNEEKAKKIVDNIFSTGVNTHVSFYEMAYDSVIRMAEWKDERVKSCFVLISKLIKDGVLTKDNIEHIMVEQMIELYNNLKI